MALSQLDLADVPIKSGVGPEDWFQTHNIDYRKVTVRQWCWIIWHYISAFGVMYAILSWLQDATVLESATTLKGLKGVYACAIGLPLYWLLPHRMVHFHDPIPYSNYVEKIRQLESENQGTCFLAGTIKEANRGYMAAMQEREPARPKLYPARYKSGIFPEWFEVHNVPYTALAFRQWCWIVWHYISAFGVMYAILSWFQDAEVLESAATLKGMKGCLACLTGMFLYWLLPHRMYHFFDPEPCTNQDNTPPADVVEAAMVAAEIAAAEEASPVRPTSGQETATASRVRPGSVEMQDMGRLDTQLSNNEVNM